MKRHSLSEKAKCLSPHKRLAGEVLGFGILGEMQRKHPGEKSRTAVRKAKKVLSSEGQARDMTGTPGVGGGGGNQTLVQPL